MQDGDSMVVNGRGWLVADKGESRMVLPADRVTGSGYFMVVRGEWLKYRGAVDKGAPVTLFASQTQIATVSWIAEQVTQNGSLEVELAEIERFVSVDAYCSYRGGGPFDLGGIIDSDRNPIYGRVPVSTPGYQAQIVYEGTELREWAESLEGFQSSGVHDAFGYCVFGIVPLSEISDYREVHTERPIPGRDGAGS